MARLIIDIQGAIPVHQAVECVRQVVSEGKISESTTGVKHYCWATRFRNGLVIFTKTRRKGQQSDSFVVRKDKT